MCDLRHVLSYTKMWHHGDCLFLRDSHEILHRLCAPRHWSNRGRTAGPGCITAIVTYLSLGKRYEDLGQLFGVRPRGSRVLHHSMDSFEHDAGMPPQKTKKSHYCIKLCPRHGPESLIRCRCESFVVISMPPDLGGLLIALSSRQEREGRDKSTVRLPNQPQ